MTKYVHSSCNWIEHSFSCCMHEDLGAESLFMLELGHQLGL